MESYLDILLYVNNIDIKRILQDKHLQLKSEQKEIIQNVLDKKIQWQCYPRASERACVTSPLFGQGKIFFLFLMVICNSLLLLKSLPINVINCIKFYVNCCVCDYNIKILFVCLYANHLP